MARSLVVPFTKMQGAGNDFVVLDNRFFHFSDAELADLARRYCPRRTGIGADGLLALAPPADDAAHFRMRYFNADGSPARMCGNGARCLARFARQAGIEAEELAFESDAGLYRAAVPAEARAPVRLFVPPPERFRGPIQLGSMVEPVWFIWTGTEHAVIPVPEVHTVDVAERGRTVRFDPAFEPEGANVNFVEMVRGTTDVEMACVRVRTYERGVEEETPACGTGALAAAIVPRLLGHFTGTEVEVQAPGGTLRVGFDMDGNDPASIRGLYLEGPAETVFTGVIELPV
jgi:diaminopimelate epimerase